MFWEGPKILREKKKQLVSGYLPPLSPFPTVLSKACSLGIIESWIFYP